MKRKNKKFQRKTTGSLNKLSLFQNSDSKYSKKCPLSIKNAPIIDYKNISLLKTANKQGFTVNISTESEAAADNAVLNSLPAVIVVKSTEKRRFWFTKNKNKILVCPAQTRGINCIDCQLCQHRPKNLIIAFLAHGNMSKLIDKILDNLK